MFTPLHYAVHHEQIEILRLLVESGADLNCISSDNSTPLHLAVKKYKMPIVQHSDDHGEDVCCCI